MKTGFVRVLGLSAALLPLTFVGPARAQKAGNVGRQVEGQVLSDVGNAVAGQPAAVPGQPAGVIPGQPAGVVSGQPAGVIPGQPAGLVPGQPAGYGVPGQPTGYGVPTTPGQALQGMERQAINNVTGAVTGQPGYMPTQAGSAMRYQIPGQFATNAPGSTVNYGGANYIINADRTMSPVAAATQPAANAMRYQIPGQFAASAPGSTVNYGGANYIINADGTMSPAGFGAQPAGYGLSATPGQAVQAMERQAMYGVTGAGTGQPGYVPTQATSAMRYQIPGQYAASAPGTTVNYGGANYVINRDNTMSPAAALTGQPGSVPTQTTPPMRYQIPAQFAASAPGTTVNYGGANYMINNDNTMSPAAR